jgi:hypothetical protein
VHRLCCCCWHANRPGSRARAPRAPGVLCTQIVCYLQIDSLTSSINHSFICNTHLFHSWQLNVLMRILTIFHLLTNLEKNRTKVQAMDLVSFVPPPPNPHKGQLGIASFPSLKIDNFRAPGCRLGNWREHTSYYEYSRATDYVVPGQSTQVAVNSQGAQVPQTIPSITSALKLVTGHNCPS